MNKETIKQIKIFLDSTLVRIRSDVANLNDRLDNLDSLVKTIEEILNREDGDDDGES